jgi:SAM-dependent methyltransferase
MAEFHDLFMVERWRQLRGPVRTAFGHLTAAHRIVDVGAGTGLGLLAIAAATPARVTCIEPSLVQRVQLTTRVIDDPDLAGRVTILGDRVPSALNELAAPLDGFVAAHMLGHLTTEERLHTFAVLRQILAPNGIGLITLPAEHDDGADPRSTHSESLTLGELTYTAAYRRAGSDYVNEYSVRRGGRILRRVEQRGRWSPLSAATVVAELGRVGFSVTRGDHGTATVTIGRG